MRVWGLGLRLRVQGVWVQGLGWFISRRFEPPSPQRDGGVGLLLLRRPLWGRAGGGGGGPGGAGFLEAKRLSG